MQGNENNQPHILIIAGMHRSGTSLLAHLLLEAGVDLGSRLLPAAESNRNGHFENLDFIELHRKILSFQGAETDGWTLRRDLSVPEPLLQEARRVVSRNARAGPWGWKDPRTTLFLDFWATELPEAKFVFAHRPPWEVVDSLFRRGDEIFQREPLLALQVWEHYNRLVLEFAGKYPERTLLVDIDSIASNWQECVRLIAERLHVPLSVPAESHFDQSLLKREVESTHWPQMVKELFPQAYELWQDLMRASLLQLGPANLRPAAPGCSAQRLGELALKDWMEFRKAERQLSRTDSMLHQARCDLYQAKSRLELIESSRIWKLRSRLQAIRTLLS
ncbi:MAG TPA: sulfotransferase [Candidatus Obscuribacterales bacterium]